jgi:hypothetical protein
LEMADVHHIPPLSRSGAPALGNENHAPPVALPMSQPVWPLPERPEPKLHRVFLKREETPLSF